MKSPTQALGHVMSSPQPEFGVGTLYRTSGKHPRDCLVMDVLRTYDTAGRLVAVRYVSVSQFMGQTIVKHDAVGVTIKKGLVKAVPFAGVPMVIGQNVESTDETL